MFPVTLESEILDNVAKKGGREQRSLSRNQFISRSKKLELEFHAKPSIERALVPRISVARNPRRANPDRLQEVAVRVPNGGLGSLVDTQLSSHVGHVE